MSRSKPKAFPKTRFALIADVHVGNHRRHGGPMRAGINRRCELILAALDRAVKVAEARGCSGIISLGDLFDGVRPTPQVVAAVQRVIIDSEMPWLVLRGNHEMASEDARDTALEALAPIASVVDRPGCVRFCDVPIACVPYCLGDAKDWVPQSIRAAASSEPVFAILHAGIRDQATPPYLQDARDSIRVEDLVAVLGEHGIPCAAAGNWHDRRSWGLAAPKSKVNTQICQVGTLAPTRYGEEGDAYGLMAIYDPGRGQIFDPVRIAGPRFVTERSIEALSREVGRLEPDDAIFARLIVEPDQRDHARTWMRGLAGSDARLLGWDVEVELGERVVHARAAAKSAADPGTMQTVLARYVGDLKLPEGVTREAVLAEARRFLAC